MTTWVAFLRGINVGGHRRLPMAELKDLVTKMGHDGVRSYIASGNLIFDAEGRKGDLSTELTEAIASRFGFDVPVVVLSGKELETIVRQSPYDQDVIDPKKIGVAFAHGQINTDAGDQPGNIFGPGDEFVVTGNVVYLHYPEGMAGSKMTTTALERLIGVPCTVRNWNTTVKMLRLLEARSTDRDRG